MSIMLNKGRDSFSAFTENTGKICSLTLTFPCLKQKTYFAETCKISFLHVVLLVKW